MTQPPWRDAQPDKFKSDLSRATIGTPQADYESQGNADSRIEGKNGIVVEDCPADNRVRVLFPSKPGKDIRTQLGQKGFRWAPSLGVWQAYRNYRSIEYAKQLAA